MASFPEGPTSSPTQRPGPFDEPRRERPFALAPVGTAIFALMVLVALVSWFSRKHTSPAAVKTLQPAAAYASNLPLSGLAMSESTSLSGGKSTYIDGKVTNKGPATVTGITVQVVFANDSGMPPQLETEPLSLIRTREPYVDTQPVSAAPLVPGGEAEFRLIFENLNTNWNGQQPEIRVVGVTTR